MTKLKEGDIIKTITGNILEVIKISESSALVRPANKKKIKLETRFGKKIEFEKFFDAYNISLNSEVKILRRKK